MTSKEKKLSIVVSHPGKQYVHELLGVLQKEGYLLRFLTSIWYKPSLPLYRILLRVPIVGPSLFQKFLRKKTYAHQRDELIEQHPWNEVRRQCLVQLSTKFRSEKYVFEVEKEHDRIVAKRLKELKPDVFIGYEKSSLQSFRVVKQQGGKTVLDLAQVHYKYLIELRNTQETFAGLFEDEKLFDEINHVKAEEYKYADHILTLSEFAKSTLVKYGIDDRKITVVSLGYNPAIFTPKNAYVHSKSTEKPYTSNVPFQLIYTGTFTKRKGVHLLLQAVRDLQLPGLQLTIIGPILDGAELFEEYKGLFKHYDFLHHEELVKHLHASDVYVFPSLLDSWAMTVVEAMACGLPAIVTENTGAKDVVEQGESGFVIPIANITTLKDKINYFYVNRSEVERMGRNASKSAQRFQWSTYHDQIAHFLNELK